MEFECGALQPDTEWDLIKDPALRDPVCHHCISTQAGGDWGTLEIAGLARCVVRNVGGGDIEACKTGKTTQDENGEEDVVNSGAQTEREGHAGGGKTEGDL